MYIYACTVFSYSILATYPAHLILLDLIIQIILGEVAVFTNSLLPHISLVEVPPGMLETMFYNHAEIQAKLYSCIF
jgi:hypothetical protein